MRHRPPHFTHVFSGGYYASAYYSYMWSEVLDADAFAAFEETGDIFDPAVAEAALRENVLSTGGSRDPAELYVAFRGRLPTADALLKKRGLRRSRDRRRRPEPWTCTPPDIAAASSRRRITRPPRPGRAILAEGGNAIEAMVAMAATIAAVYPHMNHIGGDGFWLVREPNRRVRAIMAAGRPARRADAELYREHETIPARGPLAALTVPGAIGGWMLALEAARARRRQAAARRAADAAIGQARDGYVVTRSQARLTTEKLAELKDVPGFADDLPARRQAAEAGASSSRRRWPPRSITRAAGLDDFYRGDVGREIAADLEQIGSPVTRDDLQRYHAAVAEPLSVKLNAGTLYNTPPPTQGLASLIILALYERLRVREAESFEFAHGIVEATKRAFRVRDRVVTDPARLPQPPARFLEAQFLDAEALQDRSPQGGADGRRPMAKATPSGWARPTHRASRCPTSSRSTGSSARAACCRRPAC